MTRNFAGNAAGLMGPAQLNAGTRSGQPARARLRAYCIVLSCVGAVAALRLAVAWGWPLPFCLFKKLTGVPCPACGCTRSLVAWTNLDLASAFFFNPLFSLVCLGGGVWLLLQAADRWSGRRWTTEVAAAVRRLPRGRLLMALTVLNWLYLFFNLPK